MLLLSTCLVKKEMLNIHQQTLQVLTNQLLYYQELVFLIIFNFKKV